MRLAARASARRPSGGQRARTRPAWRPGRGRRRPRRPGSQPSKRRVYSRSAASPRARTSATIALRGLADGALVLVGAAGADLRPGVRGRRGRGCRASARETSVEARIYSPDAPSWRASALRRGRARLLHFRAMNPRTDLWLQNLLDERDGAALYEGLARYEKDAEKARSFREIAEAERRHAEIWRAEAREGGGGDPARPALVPRPRAHLARAPARHAPRSFPMVLEAEAGDADKYDAQGGDAIAIADEERAHRRHARRAEPRRSRPRPASSSPRASAGTARRARRARSAPPSSAMNDGLVSNLSLILGVAGAGVEPRTVVVTGFAGLLAGAFSMAAGEYTSVASQRDLLARQVEMERREIEEAPEEEAAELALIFKQKGLSTEQASRTAAEILKNPEQRARHPGARGARARPDRPRLARGARRCRRFAMFSVGALVPDRPVPRSRAGTLAIVVSAALAFARPRRRGRPRRLPLRHERLEVGGPHGGARRARRRRHLRAWGGSSARR